MVVRRAEMLPIECIVRGYLSGSAWAEYRRSGTMHGQPLPAGMSQSEKLPEPVFTPSTKATVGHDENISFEDAVGLIGDKMASAAREICIEAYRRGAEHGARRGIIIADTKFELGVIDGELAICDEILTPDSSRFWPEDLWQPGATPPSFDKQPLRDWLEATGWGKVPPPPALPPDVVEATRARYVEAYERLSGLGFSDWPGNDQPRSDGRGRRGPAARGPWVISRPWSRSNYGQVSPTLRGPPSNGPCRRSGSPAYTAFAPARHFACTSRRPDDQEARRIVEQLSQRLLANPVIEDASVSIVRTAGT